MLLPRTEAVSTSLMHFLIATELCRDWEAGESGCAFSTCTKALREPYSSQDRPEDTRKAVQLLLRRKLHTPRMYARGVGTVSTDHRVSRTWMRSVPPQRASELPAPGWPALWTPERHAPGSRTVACHTLSDPDHRKTVAACAPAP